MLTNEQTKPALRRAYAKKAKALTPAYRKAASAAISEKLRTHPDYRTAKGVFVYISTPLEPDTAAIIRSALASGKRVFVPKCGPSPHMDAVEIDGATAFAPGSLGIPEPQTGRIAAPGEIDLTVVPCIAADKSGVRLGHGGGYYDAFLQTYPCRSLCLCFGALLAESLPAEPHDVRVNAVLTEGRRD